MVVLALSVCLVLGQGVRAQTERAASWRVATEKELAGIVPERAQVVAERIETELRTASGVTDGKGRYVAGVVLITAGYSANDKYTDYLLTQVPLEIGRTVLPEGRYLLGWTRGKDELEVTVSEAASGKALVKVTAVPAVNIRGVQSIHIWPPADHSVIQLGRFMVPYRIH